MKTLLGIVVSALVAASTCAAEAGRPNIVLILADDLGWKDVGYQGSDFYETPNIDRLAKEGMVFTNAYAAAGNCQPSRACLLSGQYTPRHGVFAVGDTNRGPLNEMRLVPIPNVKGLADDNVTMAEALKAAGYATGIFGKWHLGATPGVRPGKQGFDTVFESMAGWKSNEPGDPKGVYSLTRAAGEFMEKNKDRPFFVYLPHYAVHVEHQTLPETLKRFKAKRRRASSTTTRSTRGASTTWTRGSASS
jgi:arylsulfatase A-like enzyme